MYLVAEVALNVPLYRNFDYLIEPHIQSDIAVGCRVAVQFGRQQLIGIVIKLKSDSEFMSKLRPISSLIDSHPIIDGHLISLVEFASHYYQNPLGESYQVALPNLLNKGEDLDKSAVPIIKLVDQNTKVTGKKQRQLIEHLIDSGSTPVTELSALGFSSSTVKSLLEKSIIEKTIEYNRDWQSKPLAKGDKPKLNREQAVALAAINQQSGYTCYLLEGVTGSGKTEVYLQALEKPLQQGQQALVLVPEIGLTPQTVNRFRRRFPNVPIMLWHSAMTDHERLSTWRAAQNQSAAIVIGTRSSVFLPFAQLAMIIVDEEHDLSFKQQDSLRYHARDLACFRAAKLAIPLILGSATPSLESVQNAKNQKYQLLTLTERAQTQTDNQYVLLDMRGQHQQSGLAQATLEYIKKELKRRKQVMVFLNRRGFSPSLICHECGWLSQCQRCSANATYHKHIRNLICHHCGSQEYVPTQCPCCGSTQIIPAGQGTEQVAEFLSEAFPDTPITRVDRDSTRKKGSLEAALNEINKGEPRILIGTQMLAKGHHFSEVSLVVIMDVDSGLYSYDFRATEHLAQLITQVSGRAGRSGEAGTVLLQTHFPEHPLLQDLINNGYQDFAHYALTEREEMQLPPFNCLAIIRCESHNPNDINNFLYDLIPEQLPSGIQLLGPVPAALERVAGKYRYQLHVQGNERKELHRYLNQLVSYISQSKLATKVRWSIDIDPVSMA
ncbi:primosomal protein N' [Pseudoalteromonas piratica]|uniref:Replication restart protein PriA n=1 Tax=Pseudoalteromonas piratica TaxID=1348114 RepID=A0A0A7EBM8_9GAMM|nr:primosomal protein N' [Pseudoalteromonas piratica]AIY63974.1 DEAD/DEAH box helicase [Pseudoalteromonas piratica]